MGKKEGADPKKAKKKAKKQVLKAVEKAKEKAKEEGAEDEKEAVRAAANAEASKVVDSATSAMLNVAKEAIVNAASLPSEKERHTPQSTGLPDPDDCKSNHKRVDQHPGLCATIKEKGHCGL